ncbi:hypothetical protein [Streptomyces sp. B1I3]|uniref:hypothetical protein n=1 Tax=Streptomyces sp. B1I3 TaxID=3042264 RepID=UPI00277DB928|nr:hypothetical protein [Streptomyces sp. B1I3]MDQ0794237.1 hypothetical protein [Streptomyces sp. B1I3]
MKKTVLFAALVAMLSATTAVAPASWGSGSGSGSGPGDRAGESEARTCVARALMFCEDFAGLRPGEAHGRGWTTDAANGTLTIERDATHHSKHLRIRTEGNGRAFLEIRNLTPPGNSFWGRVRLRVDAFPTAPDWAHWTIVEATGEGPGYVRPLGGQYVPGVGENLWGAGSDGGPTGDWTAWHESAPARAGTWQCVEWRMDASDNKISLWIDGEAKPELAVSTHHHGGLDTDFVFPRFDTLKIGWQLYQGSPSPSSYDARMDDIALDGTRLGC